jgi:hypothetical protein
MWGNYYPLIGGLFQVEVGWSDQTLEFIVSTHESLAMFGKNEMSQKIE